MRIPTVIFQTCLFKQPSYIIEQIQSKSKGWTYYQFNNEEIVLYLKENVIPEFIDAVNVFNSFSREEHKSDFFKYYYLYLNGGVHIDSNAMLEREIEYIVGNYSFFTVKSAVNNNSMFSGFLGSEKKNIIIYNALKNLYNLDKNVLLNDNHYISKDLYNIIDSYNNIVKDILVNSIDIISLKNVIYIERLNSTTESSFYDILNDKEEVLLKHYYNSDIIPAINNFPNNVLKNINETKIGITLHLPNSVNGMFQNGIIQNVLYLGELLNNIGYDCYFIIDDSNLDKIDKESLNKIFYSEKFKYIKLSTIYILNFDIVFTLGFELPVNIIKQLRYLKTKLIAYLCGNSYFIDTEKVLYNQHKKKDSCKYVSKNDIKMYDQLWGIPQMINTNQHYWETLYRTKCIEVPFIWSENAIKLVMLAEHKEYDDLLYKPNVNTIKKIAIFEPNISIMKWAFPSLLVCENAYRLDNKNITQVFVNNISNFNKEELVDFNLEFFNKIVHNLDLCIDKKVSIEGRYNTLGFMTQYANIAVSHQWENNLNYLYFDLAWMGWPIVHNASLCKEVGYYYDQFNYIEGGDKLIEAINNHDTNKDSYLTKNRKVIDNYLTTNVDLQKKYINLINDLFM